MRLHSLISPVGTGQGVTLRTILLLMTGALASCATGPSAQLLNARAMCQQLAQASASSPELISDAYFDQCMIARGYRSQN
jgi:hypothetical protein